MLRRHATPSTRRSPDGFEASPLPAAARQPIIQQSLQLAMMSCSRLCSEKRRWVSMRGRLRRSTGTALTPRDVVNLWRRVPREAASTAAIAAVDRGEGRKLFCYHRALYGQYPRRFMACMLDLTAASWSSVSGDRTSP
jgi:hypothetical protein